MARGALGGRRAASVPVNEGAGAESVRLDVWLDVACVFATRSQAKDACGAGYAGRAPPGP